jgi:hypothetical protein
VSITSRKKGPFTRTLQPQFTQPGQSNISRNPHAITLMWASVPYVCLAQIPEGHSSSQMRRTLSLPENSRSPSERRFLWLFPHSFTRHGDVCEREPVTGIVPSLRCSED